MSEEKKIRLLEELVRWTRVTSIPHVKRLLDEILSSPEEKVAYQASDGKSSQEVAKLANVSYVTVTLWWKKWVKAGLAEAVSVMGGQRAKRVFSLDDFGIAVPKLVTKQQEKRVEEKPQPQPETRVEGQ